ncbi:MAG TPA: S8 family serine peptidase [Solirubrobacteraceae bacterium]|nr:S8 family serine peptidase [Solirubrobacteraceae bacterium]
MALSLGLTVGVAPAGASAADHGVKSPVAGPASYVPGRLIVGYTPPVASASADIRGASGLAVTPAAPVQVPQEQVLRLPAGHSVAGSLAAVRRVPGISFAVPDYIAHAAGTGAWYPNDPGRARRPRGWEKMQWNFLSGAGVNAPAAWANLRAAGRPGASRIKVAVLDTGIAYRNWREFKQMPDFASIRFIDPCDLVDGRIARGRCTDPNALDRNGHGTFVAAELAEATNNRHDLAGLAYRAWIMPVRVLNANGDGGSASVSAGIRYAVTHGAQVVNLSLQFGDGLSASDIPNVMSALQYANDHNVVVVAAAGNDASKTVSYPARARTVISVGATTKDRCLANYSDSGQGLDLVAPGGGRDAGLSDSDCHPGRRLPNVYQMDFRHLGQPRTFGYPGDWSGTSMAAPEVSAAAAMVIAGGVLGPHPKPAAILTRLEQTATALGGSAPNADYGYGLVNLGAATAHSG